tara:strand:+ start:71 stop:613 length:543 start_codon:yes stop_codon:yes gene_type:complete
MLGVRFGSLWNPWTVDSRYVEMVPGAGGPEPTWVPEMVPGAGGMEVHYLISKDDPSPAVLTMEQAQNWREHVLAVLEDKLGFRLTSGRELYENGKLTLFEYSALPYVNKTCKQFWEMADGKWRPKFKWTVRMVNRVTWRVWALREHMAAFRICRFLRDTTCNPVYAACRRRLELEAMDLD